MAAILDYLARPFVQWTLVWVALGFVALLLALRKPKTLILTQGKEGRLEISRHALNRLLEACCEQLSGVASARAYVSRSRGKFRTTLRLKVRPNAKLDAIRGYLAEEIALIYRNNLGLADQVGPIHVQVVGVVRTADQFSER